MESAAHAAFSLHLPSDAFRNKTLPVAIQLRGDCSSESSAIDAWDCQLLMECQPLNLRSFWPKHCWSQIAHGTEKIFAETMTKLVSPRSYTLTQSDLNPTWGHSEIFTTINSLAVDCLCKIVCVTNEKFSVHHQAYLVFELVSFDAKERAEWENMSSKYANKQWAGGCLFQMQKQIEVAWKASKWHNNNFKISNTVNIGQHFTERNMQINNVWRADKLKSHLIVKEPH